MVFRKDEKVRNAQVCYAPGCEISGKEVIGVYVAPKESLDARPYHELRAFEKIEPEPGQEKVLRREMRSVR